MCRRSQANLAQPGLGEHRLKIAMVEVVRVQDPALGRREDQIVGNVFLPLEEASRRRLSRSSINDFLSSRERSTRRLFLLLVVVCSRRT